MGDAANAATARKAAWRVGSWWNRAFIVRKL